MWTPDDVDAALTMFDELPPDAPDRAEFALTLLAALLDVGLLDHPRYVDRALALADIAAGGPDVPDWFPGLHVMVRAMALAIGVVEGTHPMTAREALAEFDRLRAEIGAAEPFGPVLDAMRTSLVYLESFTDGNIPGIAEAGAIFDQLESAGTDADDPHPRVLRAMFAASLAAQEDDPAASAAALEGLDDALSALDPGDPTRADASLMSTMMHGGSAPAVDLDRLRASVDQPGLPPGLHALRLTMLATALLAEGGVDGLDEAVSQVRRALAIAPPGDPRQASYRFSLGEALLRRFDATGQRPDLADATVAFEQALAAAGSPAHRFWAVTSIALGRAHRLAGRKVLGAEVARRGLRARAWSVMLQPQTRAAAISVRDAAEHAVTVARWYLDDNDPAGAAITLDAGRALILFAANEVRQVTERLTERGEGDLAREWRAAAARPTMEEMPYGLRRRVLSVLAGVPFDGDVAAAPDPGHASRLLDPPDLNEVRLALRATGADALIYLVAGDATAPGLAVIVPVAQAPTWLRLPRLVFDARVDLASRYDAMAGWRDMAVVGQSGTPRGTCEWAWDVAIGPILDAVAPTTGALPSLVLVPMGELARIPWHAARRRTDGSYAVRLAVFSYAASARMLCEGAWSSDDGTPAAGLVVGDPDTHGEAPDLAGARAEALAVHAAFCPGARYLGRLADGTVAPDGRADRRQVLDWLGDPDGGELLHLACHGTVLSRLSTEDSSYLLLAGGERLSAEDLIRALTARATRPLRLAVLAACHSGTSGRGYDEAFSLASALLVTGARTVVSSLWSLPDAVTSVLMYLFHYHLRERALNPREALREAQLWMLDPDRTPPPDLPAALRASLSRTDPSDVAAWAGFIHQGR